MRFNMETAEKAFAALQRGNNVIWKDDRWWEELVTVTEQDIVYGYRRGGLKPLDED